MTRQLNKKPDKKELRKFAITISVALGVLGCIVLWRKGQTGSILLSIAAVIFIAGLIWPKSLALLYKAWFALALVIGFIMNHIILALVYYLVLTPIGLLMRILGKDRLELSIVPKADSYWIKREQIEASSKNYEKMF